MKYKSLMSAAHAAGFAMAVPEEFLKDDPVTERQETQDAAAQRGANAPTIATALSRPQDLISAAWLRDWVTGLKTGRVAA